MSTEGYIGIDRQLALLVVLETLHRLSYIEIDKTLLALMVKNSSLINWYPENRELPDDDFYRGINPWIDDMFGTDIPRLIQKGFVKEGPRGVELTQSGRILARSLMELPQYQKFREQVRQLFRKYGQGSRLEWLRSKLISDSKSIPFNREAVLYDYSNSIEKLPVGLSIEADKLTPHVDLKEWATALKRRLKKTKPIRASHDEGQLLFLQRICEEYGNCPLPERPLIEICGQCNEIETFERCGFQVSRFSVFIEGTTIFVVAKDLFVEPSDIRFHSLRIQGFPQIKHGSFEVEATLIFDRGKYYPINRKAF